MMQFELPFEEKYDIFTDRLRPVSSRDFAVYREGYHAYIRTRIAMTKAWSYAELIMELDKIHDEFKRSCNVST